MERDPLTVTGPRPEEGGRASQPKTETGPPRQPWKAKGGPAGDAAVPGARWYRGRCAAFSPRASEVDDPLYGSRAEVDKVTGSGEDWFGDGLDVVGADAGLWSPGVDYVAGWREARQAADQLNRNLAGAGFELSDVRAVASTDADGRGLVRLAGWPDAVNRLAEILGTLSGGDGEAA